MLVSHTGYTMLGVEMACKESAGEAAYLWKAQVRKVHVSLRQRSGKENECVGKDCSCKFRRLINFD